MSASTHRLQKMSGRDPDEPHRVATPLELLFDLTFVVYLLFAVLVDDWDGFHTLLLMLTFVVLAGAVALAAAGVPMAVCLLVIMLAPVVTIVGFEWVGYRHAYDVIKRRLGQPLHAGNRAEPQDRHRGHVRPQLRQAGAPPARVP